MSDPTSPTLPNRHSADHLPVLADVLIGRERALAELRHLVADPASPLVVLTGPGGIGKSRVAATLAHAYSQRPAVLVELGRLPSGRIDLVIPTIAAALGVTLPEAGSDVVALTDAIGSRDLLIVLDGMEHLVEAGPLLTALLRGTPNLSILVTSQTVLDLYGERVYPLAPLTYPPEDDRSGQPVSLEAALTYDAVRLFVERMADSGDSVPAESDVPALLAIARRLEGHPLAIELAAAHARATGSGLHALADALRRDPASSAQPPMGPLAQTLARSYERLSPEEQMAFRRASLLGGAWTIADAVPVLAIGTEDETTIVLAALLDASLVRILPASGRNDRMQILEPLRVFGFRMLDEAGERDATEARLAKAVLSFAERVAPELTGDEQASWLDRVDDRLPDVRHAIAWFDEHGQDDCLLRLVTSLWRFGYTRGQLHETVGWLEMALANSVQREEEPASMALRGRALNALGLLVGMRGHREQASRHYAEAYALGQTADDADVMGIASLGLGEQAMALGDRKTAHATIERGILQLARGEDLRSRAVGMTNLANVLWSMGRLDEAYALNREARTLYTRVGDTRGIAWSVTNLGRIALQRDDLHEAIPLLQEALHRSLEPDDRFGIAETLDALARCALARQDARRAALIVSATDRLRGEIGFPVPEVDQAEDVAFRRALAGQRAWDDDGKPVDLPQAFSLALGIATPESPETTGLVPSGLSARELDVLRLIQQGMSNQEIADTLFIGIRTVQSHVLRLMRKLDASSRVAAVAIARQRGMLAQDA